MKKHQKLKKENISAYLMECLKAETLVHMYELDEKQVENYLVKTTQLSEEEKAILKADYVEMIAEIKSRELSYGQHIEEVETILEKLKQCHLYYLEDDTAYRAIFKKTAPYLEPKQMALIFGGSPELYKHDYQNPVAIGLHYMHNYLMARLEGHEFSKGIALILSKIGDWLQALTQRYHQKERVF